MDKNLYNIREFKLAKPDVKDGENLSLFIENQLFKYCVFNHNFTVVNELASVSLHPQMPVTDDAVVRINTCINNFRLGGRKFKSVNVTVFNNDFTLMPQAYQVENNSKSFLEFAGGVSESAASFSAALHDINFCYTIRQDVYSAIERTFKNATIRHAGTVCINLLFGNSSLKNCDLLLHFSDGVFEMAARRNSQLLYYNVFKFESNEDVLYYLLFMMEQYELNPLTCRVVLAGEIDAESELHKAISKYIKSVNFAVNDKSFVLSLGDLQVPNHHYFSLLNQHLCE